MLTVHPEYDPMTRTWFVPDLEFEASTLAQLAQLLGPGVKIRDYYPRGLGPTMATTFIKREVQARPPVLRPYMDGLNFKHPVPEPERRKHGRPRDYIDQVLDLWSTGHTAQYINGAIPGGVSKSQMYELIRQARAAGDPRSERKTTNEPEHLD